MHPQLTELNTKVFIPLTYELQRLHIQYEELIPGLQALVNAPNSPSSQLLEPQVKIFLSRLNRTEREMDTVSNAVSLLEATVALDATEKSHVEQIKLIISGQQSLHPGYKTDILTLIPKAFPHLYDQEQFPEYPPSQTVLTQYSDYVQQPQRQTSPEFQLLIEAAAAATQASNGANLYCSETLDF
jgi:hypothetical protein